ncbi:MAG: tetratricopeptide repeat protein [Bacteroidales bacterium]|nr:tetratricopeptide repeat protein [Bacteroidales bacterium]
MLLLPLAGCGGAKRAAVRSPYEREPIREVSEAQLKADGLLIDAVALQESGRTEQALDAYAALTREVPEAAAAWYEMGQLLLQRGWTDSALACAQRAVALQGENIWYLLSLAQVHGRRGDAKALAATWERIVGVQPEVLDYYYELSNAYITLGDIPRAVEALNRVERKIGVTEPVSMQKQRLWQAVGKEEKALKELETLAAAYPKEQRYNAVLAETHMRNGRPAKAKTYYDRILQAHPDDPYIHIQLAEYYKATGQPDKMDSELLQGFANPGLDSKSKLQLLQGFYTAEEFLGPRSATTFRLVDMAMAGCQDSAGLGAYYGNLLMLQHRYEEAVRWLELALQRDSSDYGLWERLLICLTEVPDSEAATGAYARRATALFPMHTLPHYLLAATAAAGERYEEALAALGEAEKWGFSNGYLEAETYALKADVLYHTGRYDEAWAAFDRCLSAGPDDVVVLNNYAYYLAEQGIRLADAEQMSRRTIEGQPENANHLDTYAWILHLMERDREALPYMQRAVELDPESGTFRRHLEAIKSRLP